MSVIANDAFWMGVDWAALEYIFRCCRICGYHADPVNKNDDERNNKCPKCGRPMAARVAMVPHGKVMVYQEEMVLAENSKGRWLQGF